MSFDASELHGLAQDFESMGQRAHRGASIAVSKTAADITRDAKIFAPVDTGNLRASIGHDVTESHDGASAEIGPTAGYGIFQEVGTSTMPPQPFLGPAFDQNINGFETAISQVIDGIWKG